MFTSVSDPALNSATRKRNKNIMRFSIIIASGIVLAGLGYFGIRQIRAGNAAASAQQSQSSAELISAAGTVLILKPGSAEWQEVKTGAYLTEGDLIRTDGSGNVSLRYLDGTFVSIPEQTTLVVQYAGSGIMEIVKPPKAPPVGAQGPAGQLPATPPEATGGLVAGKAVRPSIILERIIPYGKSLELIGRVEAGSRLTVNDEKVDVEGDGLFKHFTKPFPQTDDEITLIFKAADLAGRTNILTVTYDFNPHKNNGMK
jgi:hypothetical protein